MKFFLFLLSITFFISLPISTFGAERTQQQSDELCKDNPAIAQAQNPDKTRFDWRSFCKDGPKSCTNNADCPQNDNQTTVTAADSNWCFKFVNGSKCLQLVHKDTDSAGKLTKPGDRDFGNSSKETYITIFPNPQKYLTEIEKLEASMTKLRSTYSGSPLAKDILDRLLGSDKIIAKAKTAAKECIKTRNALPKEKTTSWTNYDTTVSPAKTNNEEIKQTADGKCEEQARKDFKTIRIATRLLRLYAYHQLPKDVPLSGCIRASLGLVPSLSGTPKDLQGTTDTKRTLYLCRDKGVLAWKVRLQNSKEYVNIKENLPLDHNKLNVTKARQRLGLTDNPNFVK